MRLPSVIADRLPVSRRVAEELREQLTAEQNNVEVLSESVADLQRQLFEPGWLRLTATAEEEFTHEGRVQLHAICRLYAIKNPLIKRGLALRSAYVWGQGVEITARANGRRHDGEQDVQSVIAEFLADLANRRAVTGPGAQDRLERELGTAGNVFIALFTRPLTGAVQARTIPADEIVDIITNPEDSAEPWYYHRRWTVRVVHDLTGDVRTEVREQLYPAVDYRPLRRPSRYAGKRVAWDSPVIHVPVNQPEGWLFGVPDAYAAIDWARAYKEFLEDWARLMRSLSRYAWKATAPGNKGAAIKARLAQAPTMSPGGEPNAAGATALLSPDVAFEAINKSGATIDAESGRPLAMMVASALDVPVTMLLADPGQTGARATAETLDQPTELAMGQRRELWAEVYQRMLRYVITEAVRAPAGKLKGRILTDAFGREHVELDGDTDPTIDITWPDLDDVDPAVVVEAIAKAAATGTVPPEVIVRLLLTALGVRDVDGILEQLVDEDGHFVWPDPPPLGGGQGSDAAGLARAGGDPADAGPGSMTPDDDGDGDGDGGELAEDP